jgi:hypothetical protein
MKRIYLYLSLILFALHLTTSAQSCLPNGISFTTQAAIDSFQVNYPGCTEIGGGLYFRGTDIQNLAGLSVITRIGGGILIDSTKLTNFQGLNNLVTIGGELTLVYNCCINNFTGLDALTTIHGGIYSEFSEVHDFLGMPNLVYLHGINLHWTGTTSFAGLENLTSLNDGLRLWYCFELTGLDGLSNITSINNSKLDFYLTNLTSLSGIDNIDYTTIGSLHIGNNFDLSICDVKCICDFLSIHPDKANIYSNAPGCDNIEEVLAVCPVKVEEINDNQLSIFPNPANDLLVITAPNGVIINEVEIINQSGQKVLQQKPIFNTIDVSTLKRGLYIVELVSNQCTLRKKLIIE